MTVSTRKDAFRPILEQMRDKVPQIVWRPEECVRKFSNGFILVLKKLKSSAKCEALVYSPRFVNSDSHLLAIGPQMTIDDYRKAQEVILLFPESIQHATAIARLQTIRNRSEEIALPANDADVIPRESYHAPIADVV